VLHRVEVVRGVCCPWRGGCEDRVLDGPASGETGSLLTTADRDTFLAKKPPVIGLNVADRYNHFIGAVERCIETPPVLGGPT